jgi:hypothetical protein
MNKFKETKNANSLDVFNYVESKIARNVDEAKGI